MLLTQLMTGRVFFPWFVDFESTVKLGHSRRVEIFCSHGSAEVGFFSSRGERLLVFFINGEEGSSLSLQFAFY